MNGSPRLRLNKTDVLAVLRGALLAAAGAIAAYLATNVIPNLDESTVLGAMLAGIGATLLNVLRKYLLDTR